MDSLTAAEFAAILFTLFNGVRLLTYLPQILKIAHDRRVAGLSAIQPFNHWLQSPCRDTDAVPTLDADQSKYEVAKNETYLRHGRQRLSR